MDYITPFINSLSKLINSNDWISHQELLKEEEKKILLKLHNANNERDLTLVQGMYKMLKRLQTLPEETVEKYLNREDK